jgi:hypothetical protein
VDKYQNTGTTEECENSSCTKHSVNGVELYPDIHFESLLDKDGEHITLGTCFA